MIHRRRRNRTDRQCPLQCVTRFKFPRLSPDASQGRGFKRRFQRLPAREIYNCPFRRVAPSKRNICRIAYNHPKDKRDFRRAHPRIVQNTRNVTCLVARPARPRARGTLREHIRCHDARFANAPISCAIVELWTCGISHQPMRNARRHHGSNE